VSYSYTDFASTDFTQHSKFGSASEVEPKSFVCLVIVCVCLLRIGCVLCACCLLVAFVCLLVVFVPVAQWQTNTRTRLFVCLFQMLALKMKELFRLRGFEGYFDIDNLREYCVGSHVAFTHKSFLIEEQISQEKLSEGVKQSCSLLWKLIRLVCRAFLLSQSPMQISNFQEKSSITIWRRCGDF
jgi:hypothetical protein